jgi:hypothetical protein
VTQFLGLAMGTAYLAGTFRSKCVRPMSEQKSPPFRTPLYHRGASEHAGKAKAIDDNEQRRARDGRMREGDGRASDKQGWEAYRKWLTRVGGGPKAGSERAPLDASIYSWKGYQNWADRVREAWKADES